MTTADLEALRSDLMRDEGSGPMKNGRHMPYRCSAGKLTIGWGQNIEDEGISRAAADFILSEKIQECLSDLWSFHWFRGLDPVRERAVVNLRYQLGYARFRGFKRFIAAMDRRDYEAAYTEILDSKYAREDAPARAMRVARLILTGKDA